MRRIARRTAAVSVLCIILIVCGCGEAADNESGDNGNNGYIRRSVLSPDDPVYKPVPSDKLIFGPDFTEEKSFPGIERFDTPFRDISSPAVWGRTIYFAASEERYYTEEIDTRHIVSYDMDTGGIEYLYTSIYELAYDQHLSCDGKRLVWTDQDVWGGCSDICVMDLESRKITKIDSIAPEAPSFLAPRLYNDHIYWLKEEYYNESAGKIEGSVYDYNCLTGKKNRIGYINNVTDDNWFIEVCDGKVIWGEPVNGKGSFCLYDIASGKTSRYKTEFAFLGGVKYSDGFAVFSATDRPDGIDYPADHYFYDISTDEITPINARDKYYIKVSERYIATSPYGKVYHFYRKKGKQLTELNGWVVGTFMGNFSENDVFVSSARRNDKMTIYVSYLNKLGDMPEWNGAK